MEVRVNVHAPALVRGQREDVPLDRVRQLPRRGAVRRVDVARDAEERHPRLAAARDREVVVPRRVLPGPEGQGDDRCRERDGCAGKDRPRAAPRDERDEDAGEERDLRRGAAEREQRDAEPHPAQPPA